MLFPIIVVWKAIFGGTKDRQVSGCYRIMSGDKSWMQCDAYWLLWFVVPVPHPTDPHGNFACLTFHIGPYMHTVGYSRQAEFKPTIYVLTGQ